MTKHTPLFAFLVFGLAFLGGPVLQLHGLASMPGDIGDARLNNYFLENIYQYFFGSVESLWHLGFFWPYPYVLGFSDNLFGASPVYILGRILTGQSDTAFQIWFFFGYLANFLAAYYALNKLGISRLSACVGATIFAFALPVSAHAGHAQLHYRFGVPLAAAYFALFLKRKEWDLFLIAFGWVVWQLYCGIYIGFFTLLLLAAMTIVHLGFALYLTEGRITGYLQPFITSLATRSRRDNAKLLMYFVVLLGLMALLFYPYLQVSHLYGVKRSWGEISTMLPRPQSYFLSDASVLWSATDAKIFSSIPMRHEHQMFIGVIPMLLALIGVIVGSRQKNGDAYILFSASSAIVIAITLYVGGFSLWFFLHDLPLASAIRAITRIDQVLLFPAAYLGGVAIDYVCARRPEVGKVVLVVVLPLLIVEASWTAMSVSKKEVWRTRIAQKESLLPAQLPKDKVIFMAQDSGPFYADELDAMWVALRNGLKTMNGYSGIFPPGYSLEYYNDCAEVPRRVVSYLNFTHNFSEESYRTMMERIIPVGFVGCNDRWFVEAPAITISDTEYTADQIRQLSYDFEGVEHGKKSYVKIKIHNAGAIPIAALSAIGKPIRISWRFLDANGQPLSGWDNRKDLPFDIPANGDVSMNIQVDKTSLSATSAMQISLVQEAVFWAHDIGVPPLTIPTPELMEANRPER